MNGNVLALQDHFRLGVEQRRRIVVRQIEDRGARRLFQRQGHFALGGFQYAPHHRQGDGINLHLCFGFGLVIIMSSLVCGAMGQAWIAGPRRSRQLPPVRHLARRFEDEARDAVGLGLCWV